MPKPAATQTTTGRCQCGAIQYEFEGKPKWVMHCHCEDCRRAVSSAVATYIGVKLDRKSTRLNSSHIQKSRMPSSA